MPYYKNNKNLHDSVVIRLGRKLKEMYKGHEIKVNPQIKKQECIKLQDGEPYYPDIIDKTAKIVYEVHWKGGRKEEKFGKLPEGWRGVNVFIEDCDTPCTIIVKMPGFKYASISANEFIDL